MSNRTLIEINHDHWGEIDRDAAGFARALARYLGSASLENTYSLERYGIRVFGMRHHSEGFNVEWGCHKASEKAS